MKKIKFLCPCEEKTVLKNIVAENQIKPLARLSVTNITKKAIEKLSTIRKFDLVDGFTFFIKKMQANIRYTIEYTIMGKSSPSLI